MQVVNYPQFKSHQSIHHQLTENAIQWLELFEAGSLSPEAVLETLLKVYTKLQSYVEQTCKASFVWQMACGL